MKIHKFQVFIIFFLVTYYLLPVSNTVHAQSVSLSITPPLIELLIKPGKSLLVAYTVSNAGDPVVIQPHIESFRPIGIRGGIKLENEILGPVRFNLDNSDIGLGKNVFLKTGDKQQFLLKIRVPDNAPNGDYYYTFYVKSDVGALFTGNNTSKSSVIVGSNILVTVSDSGKLESNGNIVKFDLDESAKFNFFGSKINLVESSSTLPFNLVIANNGKNTIKPDGKVVLKGPLGTLSEHDVTPLNILANSQRLIPATPSAGLENDPYSFTLKGFFIGRHRLNTSISFGEGTTISSKSITFLAIPFRLIMALLTSVVVGVIIAKRLKKDSEVDEAS